MAKKTNKGRLKKLIFFVFYEIVVLLFFAAAFGYSLYKILVHVGIIKIE